MQETCTLWMYLSSNLPTSTIPYKGLPKINMLQKCVEIPSYLHAICLNQNETRLKTVIKKLEGELSEQEKRFTEVGNRDYDALTKIEGSIKKYMEQFGENLMKHLLYELQDSKWQME